MTELEIFRSFIKDRFGFTHCDESVTHDGQPWFSFSDGETYTFFTFDKEEDSFERCLSRRFSDHAKIELPSPMRGLCDDFQEMIKKEEVQ